MEKNVKLYINSYKRKNIILDPIKSFTGNLQFLDDSQHKENLGSNEAPLGVFSAVPYTGIVHSGYGQYSMSLN